jgi:Sugar (and other) transporter
MVLTDVTAFQLSPAEHQVQLRRAVIASTIGTAIEWYDFFLYSTVTGLVFAKLFFPNSDPWVGTLEAFAIYAVGFVARPVGAAIFGHYGDRIGRKSTLIATLLLMGLATFAVALVPTYEQIGIWGAVILTILRFIQGIGVGGEWGGSVLMSMEWARTNHSRGVRFGRPRKMTPHQRQEAMQRLAAGETQADVARTYNVDATTIGRLLGDRPFHGGANLVALQ